MQIGFIGTGAMSKAIVKGLLQSAYAKPEEILCSRRSEEALAKLKDELGVRTNTDNREVAATSDILFLGVKAHQYQAVIEDIRDTVRANTTVVSIAAGISLASMKEWFNKPVKLVRTMPNTPALVQEGMISVTFDDSLNTEEQELILELFRQVGRVEAVPEELIHAVIGASGSSPALFYQIVEAMSDAAVRAGMNRSLSYTFIAQAMLGSAKMILETKEHPGALKDAVCSPGGTTIEAVATAEANGLRAALLAAVDAAVSKSIDMSS